MKTNLSDVTFTIPIRIDSEERLENLKLVINYLTTHFDTNIMVQENDVEPKVQNIVDDYTFIQDTNIFFYRTRILNQMCRRVTTPIIVNYDCDVLFPTDNYAISAEVIRSDQVDGVYPYDGLFLDIGRHYMEQLKAANFSNIQGDVLNPKSVGGCIFWNREAYIKGGMENERFISWGTEDVERHERFLKLGYRVARLTGPLYHIHHLRIPINHKNNPFQSHNDSELKKVMEMSKEELQEYIKSWY
jgi:predicted glycosyltransferase involved in capsule biosynthesis